LFGLKGIPLLGNFVLLAILFNIILAVFNLIPIPPLDGSRMVYASVKSPKVINTYKYFAQFGMLILIGFLVLGGFERIILPVVGFFYSLLGLPLPALTIEDTQADDNFKDCAEFTRGRNPGTYKALLCVFIFKW